MVTVGYVELPWLLDLSEDLHNNKQIKQIFKANLSVYIYISITSATGLSCLLATVPVNNATAAEASCKIFVASSVATDKRY